MAKLSCKIECLRQRMHVMAFEKGMLHPEVLMISCKLDEVLNEFYKTSSLKRATRCNNDQNLNSSMSGTPMENIHESNVSTG